MSEMQDLLTSNGRADWILHGLPKGEVLTLAHGSGRLSVVAGQIWLTRAGDLDDHVLGAGESIDVADGDRALVEPWDARGAALAWHGESPGDRARRAFGRIWQQLGALANAALPHNRRDGRVAGSHGAACEAGCGAPGAA